MIGQTINDTYIANQDTLNQVIADFMADYSAHPAFYGVHAVDEPAEDKFINFMQVATAIRACKPNAFIHACMMGYVLEEQYIDEFLENDIGTLAFDSYMWKFKEYYITQTPIMNSDWYAFFDAYAKYCAENNLELSATTLQTFGNYDAVNSSNEGYRPQTVKEMRYQMYASLLFAPEYLVYFHYWQSRYSAAEGTIMDEYGNKLLYDAVQALNEETLELRTVLANFDYKGMHLYSASNTMPDYYTLDNTYTIKGITCSGFANETLVSELYDAEMDYTAYMLMNSTDPSEEKTSSITINFESCSYAVIYEAGAAKVVELTNGQYTFELGRSEGILVLPY